jgi:hypothetical protein
MKMEADNDHPLIDGLNNEWKLNPREKSHPAVSKGTEDVTPRRNSYFSLEELTDELESVALEWKSVRAASECPCSTPLDFASFKVCNLIIELKCKLANFVVCALSGLLQ